MVTVPLAQTESMTGNMPISPNGAPAPLQILRLRPTDPVSWALMPIALMRMEAFIERMRLDTPFPKMSTYVRAHWAIGSESVAIWVALDGRQVVGHALATIEMAWDVPYAMGVQVEIDRGYRAMLAQGKAFIAEMKAWAKSQQARELKILTPWEPKLWQRHAGFTFDKYLLTMRVEL